MSSFNLKGKSKTVKRIVKPIISISRFFDQAHSAWRVKTAAWRSEPSFLIIGTQRGGTTSLFEYLRMNPHLAPAMRKEIHYFDGGTNPDVDTFQKGYAWYRSHFPLQLAARKQAFEATPLYLFHPQVPQRIHQYLPEARLIVLLRDPVARAYSHYLTEVRKKFESLSFLDALHAEDERLQDILRDSSYKQSSFIHHSYRMRGHYAEQLKRYLEYFSLEQILILQSEELYQNPAEVLHKVSDFLGVPTRIPADLKRFNSSKGDISMPAAAREYLQDYFRPLNEQLFELIGRRFDWDQEKSC